MSPTELRSRLSRVTDQQINFSRAKISRIDLDEHFVGLAVDANLLPSCAASNDFSADNRKRALDEVAHRMSLSCCKHVVVWLVLLDDQPHGIDKITRVTPVALGIQVSSVEFFCNPCAMAATARVTLRVTKVSPRSGLSWLKRIPLDA